MFVADCERPVDENVLTALWRLAAEEDQEISVQALNGLARAGERSVLPPLIREIDYQAEDEDAVHWWDTFEAVEALPDPSLIPHLLQLRETMSKEEDLPEYWMRMVEDAIAACSATRPATPG